MSDISFPVPEGVTSIGPVQRSVKKDGLSYMMHPDLHNLYAAFYRFVPERPTQKADKDAHKRAYLDALVRQWEHVSFNREVVAAVARRQYARQQARYDVTCETRSLTLQSRLVAGLGYDGPLEVGFSLHPLYGFPYLPGSSVKGLVRSYVRQVVLPEGRVREGDVYRLFGNTPEASARDERRGVLSFEDAIPAGGAPLTLEVDVMTPHYSPYYTGGDDALPGDWHEPTPVPFLTVKAGSAFSFSVAAPSADDAQQAASWLEEVLTRWGAGGKTRAGYGLFQAQGATTEEDVMALVREARSKPASVRGSSTTPGSPSKPAGQGRSEPPSAGIGAPVRLPPKKPRVGKNTRNIIARVLGPNTSDNEEFKTDVELHVEGYEGKRVPMTGRYREGLHQEGDLVEVEVVRMRKREVALVKRQRAYDG